jgi:gamma-glutamyltranspeptidase / glutathione hydrolase
MSQTIATRAADLPSPAVGTERSQRRSPTARTRLTRRAALRLGAATVVAPFVLRSAAPPANPHGILSGEPTAEKVAARVLADGGNFVDALVAGALAGAVAAPHQTGIGGYGAAIIIARADGKRVVCIDANSAAPAAARPDMFKPDGKGNVPGRVNETGWLAAGVPGILAGLQLALDRHGTRPFRELVAPAIVIARDGFKLSDALAKTIASFAPLARSHEGGRKLFFKDGAPLAAGDTYRNPEVAALLETLAQRNSVDSFYRGDLAQRIGEAFQKHGGLVTPKDMAAYQAREVEPLRLEWNGFDLRTAPLTAGGLTVFQALATLREMDWGRAGGLQPPATAATHARLEALRLAWADRLALLGDPEHAQVPVAKLLSAAYAKETAQKVRRAVKEGKVLAHAITPRDHTGTINLSVVDRDGNLAAITLTHGNGFGARVTVDGLGLTLGHGMSRFDPQPGHPNCPGPGKRPLHNMVPTIVLRGGRPVLAVGGRGGRKIPNALFEVLTHYVGLGESLEAALAAPRLHTEGNLNLELEAKWPAAEVEALAKLGYKTKTAASATMSAAAFNPETGEGRAALR